MFNRSLVLAVMFLFAAANVFAAPVKLVDDSAGQGILFESEDNKLRFIVGAEYESVFERSLEDNVDIEFQSAAGEFAVQFDETFKVYGTIGQAMGIEETEKDGADTIKYDIEDTVIWGAGLAVNLFEAKGVKFFTDAGYRTMEDADYDSVNYNGTSFTPADLGIIAKAGWEEWHLALGASKKFDIATVYGGVRYSEVEASMDVTIPSLAYNAKVDGEAEDNVGIFLGAKITPSDNFSINIQGRFIDETAMTLGATFKF